MPPANACVMTQHFKWYGRLCLISGCFYVHNLQKGAQYASANWCRWHTLYSLCCIVALYTGEFAYILKGSREEFQSTRSFTRFLYWIIYGLAQIKVAVNIFASVLKTSEMVEFFREAERFEKDANFQMSKRTLRKSKVFFVMRIAMATLFCLAVVMNFSFLDEHYDDVASASLRMFIKTVVVLNSFLYIPHDTVHSNVLRPTCEVLAAYIRSLVEELAHIAADIDPASRLQNLHRLEQVRLRIGTIRRLKTRLDRAWMWPLILANASVLLSMSIDAATAFGKAMSKEGIYLSAVFSAYETLDFADLAMLSQEMVNEAEQLKAILKTMAMTDSPEVYIQQVRFLYDSTQPSDMRLNCGNFFKLDTPLIVTMAGAIITYTVVLAQTADQVDA